MKSVNRLYIPGVILAGAAVTIWAAYQLSEMGHGLLWEALFFALLVATMDSLPILLPRGGSVTVGFALYLAAIILFEPPLAIATVVLGDLLSLKDLKAENFLVKVLFNASQLSLAVAAGALTYQYLGGTVGLITPGNLLVMTVAAMVCFAVNLGAVTLVLAFTGKQSPWFVLNGNLRWYLPNFLALAPLGYVLASSYQAAGPWGALLFLVPLLVVRHSFKLYNENREAQVNAVMTLAKTLDAKDPATSGHSERVAVYTAAIARELALSAHKVEQLQNLALLHDIGKIGVPDSCLLNKGCLSAEEFALIQKHAPIGGEVVAQLKFFGQGDQVVRHHHERWDGKGYPDGLRGEEIPLGARIIAAADAYDAMTSCRPYRNPMNPEAAREELALAAGSQLDPQVVRAFLRLLGAGEPLAPASVIKAAVQTNN